MKWFADLGHPVTGIDCSPAAVNIAAAFGEVVLADIENGRWPLAEGNAARQFSAIIVTNFLWRPLFPLIKASLLPGGLLIYETFSKGHERLGRPTRLDFLLQPGELLRGFADLRIIAFEEGFVDGPPRFLQRFVAARPDPLDASEWTPERYAL